MMLSTTAEDAYAAWKRSGFLQIDTLSTHGDCSLCANKAAHLTIVKLVSAPA